METHIILIVASILLSGACIGPLIVRLSNPFFKGLGWLGCAFGAGALGTTAFALPANGAGGSFVLIADTLILLAFVLLHVCFLDLCKGESRLPRLGIALLVLQALAYFVFRHFHDVQQLSAVVLGVAVAVQVCQSAVLLKKTNKEGMDAPVWYSIVLLVGFAAYNVFRSMVILALGKTLSPQMPSPLETTTALVFLGTALGLGFGAFWMISAQIRLKLEHLASIDPLTGIYNRRSFIALCEQQLLRTSRSGEVFSLIMFDLDHFKTINDRHGHRVGDAVLCAVVEKLRNSVRNIDIVARWGGEEFVALLPKADSGAALLVARRLRHHVEAISIASPQIVNKYARGSGHEEAITITLSIGVATYYGRPTATIHDLLHQCDAAMYQAKADGRDRIVCTNSQLALSH